MRIVGEIAHPKYKITIFQMNERLSLKIEDQLLEQIYKFRDGTGVSTPSDVEAFVTDEFMDKIETTFSAMRSNFYSQLEGNNPKDDFLEII